MSAPVTVYRSLSRSRFRSKTVTAALAFLLGWLGAHRFYLYGWRDVFGWAHVAGTTAGVPGIVLLVGTARASPLGWALAVLGAVSLLSALLTAIVYGLRPDPKWDAQFNEGSNQLSRSGWGVVFVIIFSLFFGAMLLMGGLAVAFQSYFESQVDASKSLGQ